MGTGTDRRVYASQDVIDANPGEPRHPDSHGRTNRLLGHPDVPQGVPREAQAIGQWLPATTLHPQVPQGDQHVRLFGGRQIDHACTAAL